MICKPSQSKMAPAISKKKPARIILVMGIIPEPYTMAFGGVEMAA